MKSNLITKSQTSVILEQIRKEWKFDVSKVKNLKEHHITPECVLLIGDGISALLVEQRYIPFLKDVDTLEKFPYTTVDKGAIRFMCNGADLMRPGITDYSEFGKNDIVCIKENTHNKFLAVGISLVQSSEIESIEKGRILKNIHYVSDQFWEEAKLIS